jgi:branched-chain amino acid aminotransferase
MAAQFTLALYPWVYVAQFDGSSDGNDDAWKEEFREQEHLTPAGEAALPEAERQALLGRRNSISGLPLVNYTTQYGFGCFEGLKAFPQKDGSLKLFRPDQNGERMNRSMKGLKMPGFPVEMFVEAVKGVVRRNKELGFAPEYDATWEKDNFLTARSVYLRPFSYTEPGIGLNLSYEPYVVIISTPVGSYFDLDSDNKAITTDKVRATKGGTGWIKCDANYVIPTMEKHAMMQKGYMETVFLDAATQSYVEEGSSSNIFFLMGDGTLVTPSLEDTILPGITRSSVIQLARDRGVSVEERRVSIEEVMSDAEEAFVTGTAAGLSYLESLTHKGSERVFHDRKMGDLTRDILHELKGIQYGAVEDRHGWMVEV